MPKCLLHEFEEGFPYSRPTKLYFRPLMWSCILCVPDNDEDDNEDMVVVVVSRPPLRAHQTLLRPTELDSATETNTAAGHFY